MGHVHHNKKTANYKHLTYNNRIQIEALVKAKHSTLYMAEFLGVSRRTIQRELKRGHVRLLDGSTYLDYDSYSADIAQQNYNYRATAKGAKLKLAKHYDLAKFIETGIKAKRSPSVIAFEMQATFPKTLCLSAQTIYNYIEKRVFSSCTSKDLIYGHYKRSKLGPKRRLASNNRLGKSIELRAERINARAEFGHWEMDLVLGKRKKSACMLVLSERKSRLELIRKIPNKSQEAVRCELDKLERQLGCKQFKQQFKSITVDNGSEFLNFEALEKSIFTKRKRCTIYYAHPFASCERGTNENLNRMIRRFIPKSYDINRVSKKQIRQIQDWMNLYPRKLLGFQSPLQVWNAFLLSS